MGTITPAAPKSNALPTHAGSMAGDANHRRTVNQFRGSDQGGGFADVDVAMLRVDPYPVPVRADALQSAHRRIKDAKTQKRARLFAIDFRQLRHGWCPNLFNAGVFGSTRTGMSADPGLLLLETGASANGALISPELILVCVH